MDLMEKAKKKEFVKTGEKKKLTIPGANNSLYDVFSIPVDMLYYNDQNGRINTTYMKFKSEKGTIEPKIGNSRYNNIFERFIYETNKPALNKTKKSIEERGQQEPGVVLSDGRIIDGNRRFTALRMMQRNSNVEQKFHAIILPLDNKSSADKKTIKTLELDLQLAREEKVNYDPIDRIFDVYNTIKILNQMTPQEYRKAAGFGNAIPVNRDIKLAELILKFIKIVSPGDDIVDKFYLARDLKLDGPMEEIDKTIDNLKSPNKEAITDAILTHILLTKTDFIKEEPTKAVRSLKNNVINKPDNLERFLKVSDEAVDSIIDAFEEQPIKTTSDLKEVMLSNEEVKKAATKMVKSTNKLIYKGGLDTKRTKVLSQLLDIKEKLEDVDSEDFDELKADERLEVKDVITQMTDIIYKLKREY